MAKYQLDLGVTGNQDEMAPNGIAIIIGAGNNIDSQVQPDMNANCVSPMKVQQRVQALLGYWPPLRMVTSLWRCWLVDQTLWTTL